MASNTTLQPRHPLVERMRALREFENAGMSEVAALQAAVGQLLQATHGTDIDTMRMHFEVMASDSYKFSRSRRGTYNNPAVARDWKWFRLGVATEAEMRPATPTAQAAPAATAVAGPTAQQAYDMGAKGAPATDEERVLFEEWMRGHCWALSATWTGSQYLSPLEQDGFVDPKAMQTRRLWAAWRDRAALAAAPTPATQAHSFQQRVQPWLLECFGAEIAADRAERNHRFLEEALELVQSLGCTASEAHQLVDYVFGRPVGEPVQETGGVMVTLAALCLASGLDMHSAGETELARISVPELIAKIRAKQAAKPKHSPLPEAVMADSGIQEDAARPGVLVRTDCGGKGVDGDAGDDGRTIDVPCGSCNGTGRTDTLYRERCPAGGAWCIHGCHKNEPCYNAACKQGGAT